MTEQNYKLKMLASIAKKYNKNFIAKDRHGNWYGYETEPTYNSVVGIWHGGGEYICLTPNEGRISEQLYKVDDLT